MGRLFEGLEDDVETRRMVATVVAAEQVRLLQANGVDEFHFYTLNRPDLVYAIAHLLGARPKPAATPA
jgi:methylenetetrahydrofolate reductase (NADPH)